MTGTLRLNSLPSLMTRATWFSSYEGIPGNCTLISDRFCIVTPTTTNWNSTTMFIQVINRANFQPTSLDEGWCDRVDLGAIMDKIGDWFTINQGLANVFRSQPPVPGIFVSVATGSIMSGSQFWAGARGALVMQPPFVPAPPFRFNCFFSFSRASLSFSEFKANLKAGFKGFLQSRHGWPGSPQL